MVMSLSILLNWSFHVLLTYELLVGSTESRHGTQPDQHLRSASPLNRSFTNTNIHPIYTQDESFFFPTIYSFRTKVKEQLENFQNHYTMKDGTFIPPHILHAYDSEQLLLYSTKGSCHPIVDNVGCFTSFARKAWEMEISKLHPDVVKEVFGTPNIPKIFREKLLDVNSYRYKYNPCSPPERKTLEDDFSLPDNYYSKKPPYLPRNLFEPPVVPPLNYNGCCLRIFHSVSINDSPYH